ncbi:hypothetical protein [Halomonas sp. SL1]|uniref:hypothetical protein n=1 Tax=Halomonas sp. SL1 TaxID=2137478 RepID=UPI0011B93CD7|nr:hypothetical protein [Halomonas sp. SL1]
MFKKSLCGALVGLLTVPFSVGAYAQYKDLESLNSDVVAAVSCSGTIIGYALNNYELGVFNEERAREVVHAASLYQLSVALDKESMEHFSQYSDSYVSFETGATEDILDASYAGNYTWQTQEEVDVCLSKMVKEIIPPYPQQLQSQEVRDRLKGTVNDRFDKMLEIYEAMQ